MKNLKFLDEFKEELISDLKACIKYIKNKENDLCCLFERYTNAVDSNENECKYLLSQIKKCMDGKKYDNPFKIYHHYNTSHIEQVAQIIDSLIYNVNCDKSTEKIKLCIEFFIAEINELDELLNGELIDGWREKMIENMLVKLVDLHNIDIKALEVVL